MSCIWGINLRISKGDTLPQNYQNEYSLGLTIPHICYNISRARQIIYSQQL